MLVKIFAISDLPSNSDIIEVKDQKNLANKINSKQKIVNKTDEKSEKDLLYKEAKKILDNPPDYSVNEKEDILFNNKNYEAKEIIFKNKPENTRLKFVLLIEYFKLKDLINKLNCLVYVKNNEEIIYAFYGTNNKIFFHEKNEYKNKLDKSVKGLLPEKGDYDYENPDYQGIIFDFSNKLKNQKIQVKIVKNLDYRNEYQIALNADFNDSYDRSSYADIIFFDKDGFSINEESLLKIQANVSNHPTDYRYSIKETKFIEKEIFYSIHSAEVRVR